ncbi:MAG: ArsR/SmtB family transcription factor [Pseudobdellovibrio sp.]
MKSSSTEVTRKQLQKKSKSNGDLSVLKIQNKCNEICLILKALSHPTRLLIMGHLINGPKSVNLLVDLCQISQSQMSQFLTRMKLEGLVKSTKTGKSQIYSIADQRLAHLLHTIQLEYCPK